MMTRKIDSIDVLKQLLILVKLQRGKKKGLSDESKPPSTFDNCINTGINYFYNSNRRVKFDGNCLK